MIKLPRRKTQRPAPDELRGYRRVLAEKAARDRSNTSENDDTDLPRKSGKKKRKGEQ